MALGLELAKPLAVSSAMSAIRDWKLGEATALLILGGVSVAYSLTAELSLMARSRADAVAERVDSGSKAKETRDARDRARIELDKLPATRPATELAPLLKSAKVLAGDCSRITTATQRDACKSLPAWESELARAPRYADLRSQLATAETALAGIGTGKTADPGSVALAIYFAALGITVDPARLGDWLVLVGVLALEVGSALGVVLVRTDGAAGTAGQVASVPATVEAERLPESGPANLPVIPLVTEGVQGANTGVVQTTREKVLALIRDSGGSVRASQRTIAGQIGVSPSRLNTVLSDLASEGVVKMRTGATGTVLAMA